ncbi:MAG: type II toxin-antitoxin system VapC family toxin [Gemmatimonadota bacterium]|nr:MAG: type II toxin-antitoxin system VapC family toxin [Gemmatimonadota bacterium]
MLVLDASAVLEVLLRRPGSDNIQQRILKQRETLHAPHLLDVEVAQVVRRYCLSGEMTESRASQAISDLADLPVTRYRHDLFLSRIWQLRHNVTAYDAAYLSLAEALEAPLVTCDARLAAAKGHAARVELM